MAIVLSFLINQQSRFLFDNLRKCLASETVCSILISNELSMYETEYQLEMSTLLVIGGSFKVEFEIGDKVHLTSARWSHQVYGAL